MFPHMKDNRIVLRIYAWLTGVVGVVTTLLLWFKLGIDLPGLPWGMASIQRVAGVLMFASGCWAAQLSQISDPYLRRIGVRWFSGAHAAVLLILHTQCIAIWPAAITSKLEPAITLLFWATLSILIHSERCFVERGTDIPAIPPDGGDLRTLYERQIRQAGAQEERNRLARDLHDAIKQQIFVIRTAAATAQTRFDNDRAGAAAALDQVRDSARDAMTEMEVMIDQLRAVPLENASLVAALKKQCEALGHRTGAKIEFTVGDLPASETLAPGVHQTILRMAQEACANIGRHARAKNVTISLAGRARFLELRIQDDGVGFEPSQGQPGLGIVNMRARAKESGGDFYLTSSPGNGVTLIFSVPWKVQLPPSRRSEYTQQILVYVASFVAVIIFSPSDMRKFILFVWCSVGAIRIFHAVRAYRRERAVVAS